MEFIDKLMKGPNPLGITVDEPKAYDDIVLSENSLNLSPELEEVIQSLVMGLGTGGGAGKGIRQLILAMKGKIKGGKMIPSQPFKQGMVGKPPTKLDILLNRLKDNTNIGGNINKAMLENIKKHKPK